MHKASYIGSSVDLGLRLTRYYNNKYLIDKRRGKSTICQSILKNGYSSFTLEIIEFCARDKCIEREQGGKND